MVENKITRDEEQVPIIPPLKVLDHKTINKRFGWWSAVVLLESYGRKQVCFYLWQKKPEGGWKRKQKFAIHNQQDWALVQEAADEMIGNLT